MIYFMNTSRTPILLSKTASRFYYLVSLVKKDPLETSPISFPNNYKNELINLFKLFNSREAPRKDADRWRNIVENSRIQDWYSTIQPIQRLFLSIVKEISPRKKLRFWHLDVREIFAKRYLSTRFQRFSLL